MCYSLFSHSFLVSMPLSLQDTYWLVRRVRGCVSCGCCCPWRERKYCLKKLRCKSSHQEFPVKESWPFSRVNWTVQTVKPRLLPTFRPLVLLSYYHGVKTCYISKTKLLDFPEAAGEWGGGVAWPGTLHRCRSNSWELGWRSVLFCWTEAVEAQ